MITNVALTTEAERFDENTATDRMGTELLGAEDLCVSYGHVTALRDFDFSITPGEIVSVIGPNGAGKTTFANTASGFLPYEGSLRYRGQEVQRVGQRQLVEDGMITCTEERDLFGHMSVEDNLRIGAYLGDDATTEEMLGFVFDLFPRLQERTQQNARSLSGGEQQMLAIGRALMGEPDLLVLDEPTLGLAPVILEDISDALDPIQDRGVTILLTEQNVTFALNHADRIYLLENGAIVKEGTAAQMRGDEYIRETYLGG